VDLGQPALEKRILPAKAAVVANRGTPSAVEVLGCDHEAQAGTAGRHSVGQHFLALYSERGAAKRETQRNSKIPSNARGSTFSSSRFALAPDLNGPNHRFSLISRRPGRCNSHAIAIPVAAGCSRRMVSVAWKWQYAPSRNPASLSSFRFGLLAGATGKETDCSVR